MPDNTDNFDTTGDLDNTTTEDSGASAPEATSDSVEVRRNVGLAALIGGVAALLTVAFAVRAFSDGALLDWISFAVVGVITVVYVAALIDSRAPLMVVDDQGVRLREGASWQGIAWPEIDCLEHLPRRGPLRDGHLLVAGYDDRQLIVPLTMATRVHGATPDDLSDTLARLADGRADVVEVVPGLDEGAPEDEYDDMTDGDDGPAAGGGSGRSPFDDTAERPAVAAAPYTSTPVHNTPLDEEDGAATGEIPVLPPQAAAPQDRWDDPDADAPEPTRSTVLPARVELDHTAVREVEAVEEEPAPSRPSLSSLWASRKAAAAAALSGGASKTEPTAVTPVEAAPQVAETSTTMVFDDVRPAAEPVIGPQLRAARERLRLTVDQLSDRTRIRPHVIESLEVDDFGPCGGDFYARGHLRTIARVLGIEAGDLLETYDKEYADEPVDPRRVFESELATGVGGSIRSTRGGRNWSVVVAGVMAAVLVWSLARLLMGGPAPMGAPAVLNQSGGISQTKAAKADAVKLTLTAAGGGAKLVVRDANGDLVFDGDLAFGQSSNLKIVPPVRIWSSDGSVTASIDGKAAEAIGDTGEEVTKTLVAP